MWGPLAGIVFDGFAYGMLLFLLSVGLSVTLGMMNFINLAHCSFGMLGGYITVTLIDQAGWPFLATLPAAFVVAALMSGPPRRVPAVPGRGGRGDRARAGRRVGMDALRSAGARRGR